MKLHHCPRTRAARPLWLLYELEAPFEIHVVDVFAGEGRKPEHLALHPHGLVPVLEDGELTMLESSAICMYLADKYPEKGLAPKVGTALRGRYYDWMTYIPATADPHLEAVMMNSMFLPEPKRIPELVERGKKAWAKVEWRIAKTLGDKPFILGDAFSAADVVVGSAIAWSKIAGISGGAAVLDAYMARVTERPAFKKAYGG